MSEIVEVLRRALSSRADHAALCGVRSKPVWKDKIKFSWVDCLARESGIVAIVAADESDAVAVALLAELNEWRQALSDQRSAVGERRPKTKGAAA